MKGVITMIKNLKLNEVLPNPFDNEPGIISKIQIYNPPWGSLNISTLLDLEYIGNVSGNKIISPIVERILINDNNDDNKLTENRLTQLANLIYTLYNNKWERLWTITQSEYNPIENYNMVEEGTDTDEIVHGETVTRTDNLTHAKTGTEQQAPNVTETETPNITETKTPNLTRTLEENIYGFNSTQETPANSGTETNTGTDTTTRTGTNTNTRTGTDTKTYNTNDADTGTQTHAHTGTDTNTKTHELERHGNIGVTTTQQMIQSEIELWQWDFFNNVLFPDIDRVMAIKIY